MFRSEEMSLCQLILQPETAYTFLAAAGESSFLQLIDMNSEVNEFKRKFVGEVRRCDEMRRRLRYIRNELRKAGVSLQPCSFLPSAPNSKQAINLEFQLEQFEKEIAELSITLFNLKSNFADVLEYLNLIERTHLLFTEVKEDEIFSKGQGESRGSLGYTCGVVKLEKVAGLERMLWRVSRGNIFFKHSPIATPFEDPSTGNKVSKTVFIAFYQGDELRSRVEKVCQGYHASLHDVPNQAPARSSLLQDLKIRLADIQVVIQKTVAHRHSVFVSVSKEISAWIVMVNKMMSVYHAMNLFSIDVSQKCLVGECWIATSDIPHVTKLLFDSTESAGSSVPSILHSLKTNLEKPTYFRCNKFTKGFQNLVDAYGIASYQEVNPALFTIITFPFLFAVMFGDLGHGTVLSVFGVVMVIREKQISAKRSDNEIWNIFFAGRYIILMMGLFSVYTGAIYNDVFGKSLNVFGSSWAPPRNFTGIDNMKDLDPRFDYSGSPYPFGMDPIWLMAENKISFMNSFKMKLSIIIGVIHMLFGVTLSISNHIHFKKKAFIILEFIPQFLFLFLLFFYLVLLMIIKWALYSAKYTDASRSPSCAPSVLILFIKMMMFSSPDPIIHQECISPFIYKGQETVQMVLMVIAIACIPFLLLGKPIYLIQFVKHSSRVTPTDCLEMTPKPPNGTVNGFSINGAYRSMDPESPPSPNDLVHDDHFEETDEEESSGEIIIHQAIHTIEYVLSTISHTASYLRLWALSLAHGQLSEVLWKMVLRKPLSMALGPVASSGSTEFQPVVVIFLLIIFSVWASFTIAILVVMEGLSAFLHTLRLHWVEFMSKFFSGTGYAFQPFSFQAILDEEGS